MIKHYLTILAAAAAAVAGTALAQAQQSYGAGQGPAYPAPYQSDRPGEYRPSDGAPNFEALEDDEAVPPVNSAALPPGPTGPVMSPDDPRYGRTAGVPPAYPGAPQGPVMSPDDPRYGRPAGPPTAIYADQPAARPGADDGLRPPGAIASQGPVGADGRPMSIGALPPEEQPDAAPTELPPNLRRQEVSFSTKEPAGTLVVDTPNTYLYYVLGNGRAIRYGVRVGRDGFTWTGVQKISRKAEWPDWHPPDEMILRQPYLPRFMAGGPGNPLGARAMYLGSTVYRIHGTNQPSTIGKFVSSGCIGMLNDDVSDLFDRVKVGTRVVVLPAGPRPGTATASVQPQPALAPVGPQAVGGGNYVPGGPVSGGGTRPTVVPPLPAPVTVR